MEYLDIYMLADARNVQIVDENLESISGLVTLFKDVPVTINLHMFNMAGEPYTEDALNNRIWSFIVAHDYNTTTTPQLRANAISVAGNVLKIEISNMNTIELNEQLKEEKSIRLGAELSGKSIEDSKDNWVMQFNLSIRNRRESNGIPTEVENNYYTKGEVDAKISVVTLDIPTKVSELENDAEYITIEQVPEVDLSEYALKSEIPDVSSFITSDALTNYALKSEIPVVDVDKSYVDAELAKKANSSEIPAVPTIVSAFTNDVGYITIDDVPVVDLSNYALKSEIPDVSSFITSDALTPYAKINYVDGQLANKANVSELANYALKTEIPIVPTKVSELENDAEYITIEQVPTTDLTNYYVKSEVDTKISNIFVKDEVNFTNKTLTFLNETSLHIQCYKASTYNSYVSATSSGLDFYTDKVLNIYKFSTSGTHSIKMLENSFEIYSPKTIKVEAMSGGIQVNSYSSPLALNAYGSSVSIFSTDANGIKLYESSGNMIELKNNNLYYNSKTLNAAGGLVKVGSNGKIPESLYDKTEVDLTPYALKSEIPVVDVDKAYVDVELAKKLNSADAFSGSYNDLTDVPEYTAENGITINDDIISLDSNNFKITNANIIIGQNTSSIKLRCNVANIEQTWIIPKVVQYAEVGSYYNARYGWWTENYNTMADFGNVHVFSLSAGTPCTLTVSSISRYNTLICVVNNANGGSLLFGDEEVISSSENGRYTLVFSNFLDLDGNDDIKLYNKIEV